MDYKTVFTNLCLELQQNRSWIKGLGKNPFTHSIPFTHSLTAVPKRVPSDSEKHRRVYTSSNVCHSHEWRVDTASGLTLKKQNACLHAVRHAVEKKLRVYTASEAKGLRMCVSLFVHNVLSSLSSIFPPLDCNLSCVNGGTLDPSTCSCTCPQGFKQPDCSGKLSYSCEHY